MIHAAHNFLAMPRGLVAALVCLCFAGHLARTEDKHRAASTPQRCNVLLALIGEALAPSVQAYCTVGATTVQAVARDGQQLSDVMSDFGVTSAGGLRGRAAGYVFPAAQAVGFYSVCVTRARGFLLFPARGVAAINPEARRV